MLIVMTLSLMTVAILTLNLKVKKISRWFYLVFLFTPSCLVSLWKVIIQIVTMQNVTILSVIVQIVTILSVIVQTVIIQSVIMLGDIVLNVNMSAVITLIVIM